MKTILVAWMLLIMPSIGLGCDVCGIFLGIQPNDRTSSLSFFWRYRRLEGDIYTTGTPQAVPKHGGHAAPSLVPRSVHYRELYQVAEIRADLWLSDRVAVLVSLPMVNNYSAAEGYVTSDIYGVGDPLIIGRYLVANTKCLTTDDRVVHRLLLGVGAKVPLGRTDATYRGSEVDVDQQPGTGTWDVLASAEYKVRFRRNGAGLSMIGRRNSANGEGYRLGHGLSTTAEAFHRFDLGEHMICMPSVGVYHELAGMDEANGSNEPGTGSSTLFAHFSSRLWWGAWGLSATYQRAIAYNLGDLMVPNRERVVVGITYNLIR